MIGRKPSKKNSKRRNRKGKRSMKGEMMNKDLPEHLVEIIISKLPFPHIFKARALSRAWLARLSSISSHDDEVNRGLAISFQNLVSESSHNWETFCPVWFGGGINSISEFAYMFTDSRDSSFAYDQASRTWRRLPSLSFLPRDVCLSRMRLQIEGALLYGPTWLEWEHDARLFVANIFTKSWKILPPRNNAREGICEIIWKKLVSDTLLGYKVIILTRYLHGGRRFDYRYSAEVYNSNSDAWTTKEIGRLMGFGDRAVAYLNGVVYIMSDYVERRPHLPIFAFSVEEGTLEVVNVSLIGVEDDDRDNYYFNLVPCNSTLMLILRHKWKYQMRVFAFDLKSRRLLLVALNPHVLEEKWWACDTFNAGDCIFFREYTIDTNMDYRQDGEVVEGKRSCVRDRLQTYNVDKCEWSCFEVPKISNRWEEQWRADRWSTFCFQPGLNPFMEV